jgi:uncharacterized membrane protein (DUF4010 family)
VPELDATAIQAFGIALLIGALIGLEREKHHAPDETDAPGLRTFILIAEIGAIAGWLGQSLASPWIVAAALLAASAMVVAGYVMAVRADKAAVGLTTEIAMLATCLLGVVTTSGQPQLATGLGVITAAVLAYKQPLHGLVDRLGWDDVYAGLRLLIAACIVLPLLPNRAVDPWGALNPASLWRLVLLISSLSLIGYVATRWLGERKGTALTGLTGGLVSSTAVTLSFARQSRDDGAAPARALAGGLLLAWTVMFVRVVVEVFVVNASLVTRVLPAFGAMACTAGAVAAWLLVRDGDSSAAGERVPLKNPFSLTSAAKFAAFFALVLVIVAVAKARFSTTGLYIVAGLAGLTDVDAITLSMAEQARTGDPGVPVVAIVIASITNTIVKAAMASSLGSPPLRRVVVPAAVAVLAAGAAALWIV